MQAIDFPPWIVPEAEAAKENPLKKDRRLISEGETIYKTQCVACHGVNADGLGVLPAASLISAEFRTQSDGSIFHKLITGRGTMPSFAALGEESLWKLILYLRSIGEEMETIVKKKAKVVLNATDTDGNKKVFAQFFQIDENGLEIPASDAKVSVYVKRYFGMLPIAGNINTDKEGKITIAFPNDIPGDDNENLTIVAILEDFEFENVMASKTMPWGTLLADDSFTKQWDTTRALWRGNTHLPYWMLGLYGGITGGILLGLLYVLLLIRKIKLAGKE